MDARKTGILLAELRKEQGLTQQQVAERLHVSNKAVSKWETGQGMPDVSLLRALGELFGVPAKSLLMGELPRQQDDKGNLKQMNFYVCPQCGGLLTGTGRAEVTCCGKTLEALRPQVAQGEHVLRAEPVEDEFYLTFDHPMTKEHFLSFVAWVGVDRVYTVRLYPEGEAALRLPRPRGGGTLYWYCRQHGLFAQAL